MSCCQDVGLQSEHVSGLDHGQVVDGVLSRLDASPGLTRRRWSAGAKQRSVAETLVAGANISAIARVHGLSVQLLFAWRRKALARMRRDEAAPEPPFAMIEVAAPVDAGVVELAVCDIVIRVGPQVGAARLREILAAVRGP